MSLTSIGSLSGIQENLQPPQHASLSLVKFLGFNYNTSNTKSRRGYEGCCTGCSLHLWPFQDRESSGLEELIASPGQDVCGLVLCGCNSRFAFVDF